jgi:hypothetical protein
MSTAAQIEANRINSDSSTGPRTEAGKAISSQNAVSHGLFATRDFIRPGEEDAHSELESMAFDQFVPEGLLEVSLVDEMVRALWRLRRCGQIEASFVDTLATESAPIPDPMQNEATARLQNSVDRARAQAHRIIHRCTQDLRRLQTERHYRNEVTAAGSDIGDLGFCDFRTIKQAAADNRRTGIYKRQLSQTQPETPSTERSQSSESDPVEIARNAPCPCNSGQKYKRCCGVNAPALRHAA